MGSSTFDTFIQKSDQKNIIRIITSKGKMKPLPFVIGPMGNADSTEFTSKTF